MVADQEKFFREKTWDIKELPTILFAIVYCISNAELAVIDSELRKRLKTEEKSATMPPYGHGILWRLKVEAF